MENKLSPRNEIELLLKGTERDGIDDLIIYMAKSGFYESPASTKYHGAYEGALAEHSLNVYNNAVDIAFGICGKKWIHEHMNSIVICSLLHDLGKVGQFNKPYYVANILKSGKASESQPYKTNDDLMTLDHELVSVIEISRFIELTEDEQHAIAYHNGLYSTIGRYQLAGKETPLQMIIHFADLWASRVNEVKEVREVIHE